MVVQTRGDEPQKPDKSWAEEYAPWLIAAGLGGLALAGGAHYISQLTPTPPKKNVAFAEGDPDMLLYNQNPPSHKPPIPNPSYAYGTGKYTGNPFYAPGGKERYIKGVPVEGGFKVVTGKGVNFATGFYPE